MPGSALATDEPGPVLFVNAGVHGGEYPAIEAVIQLSKTLDPQQISGTVILMPVLNLPAFRTRTPFVCPIDNVNPNRVFPGDPNGTYSEQMTHALINEFVVHADAYIDKGVPSILAEAGGVGQMQEEAVAILAKGVVNVMQGLDMLDAAPPTSRSRSPKPQAPDSRETSTSKME